MGSSHCQATENKTLKIKMNCWIFLSVVKEEKWVVFELKEI